MEKFSDSHNQNQHPFTEQEVQEVAERLGDVWFDQYMDSGISSIGTKIGDIGPYIAIGVEHEDSIMGVSDIIVEHVPAGMPALITITGRFEAQ